MNVATLLSTLRNELEIQYRVKWNATQCNVAEGDLCFEFSPSSDTLNCFVGFRLYLSYARLSLELAVINPPTLMNVVFKSIENNGKRNLSELMAFETLLNKQGGTFTYRINGRQYQNTSLSKFAKEPWIAFSVRYNSGFLDVYQKMDFHYEVFKQIVLDFAGYILLFSTVVESEELELHEEGGSYLETSVKYERNLINRRICLRNKGYCCSVCGLNMEDLYGDIGKNYIEVHHSIPVSEYGQERMINPMEELFPVCPNCHAMIHRRKPPYSISEIKERLQKKIGGKKWAN